MLPVSYSTSIVIHFSTVMAPHHDDGRRVKAMEMPFRVIDIAFELPPSPLSTVFTVRISTHPSQF